MRLSADQVKQAILHSDPQVRFAAIEYFTRAHSRDVSVMPVAIQAVERFGWYEAFGSVHPLAELAQTPETIQWAIEELGRAENQGQARSNLRYHLSELLCNADPQLIVPHEAAIFELAGFTAERRPDLRRRLEAMTRDDEDCWREIEALCEQGKNQSGAWEFRYDEAEELAEALGRRGDRHAARMMSRLEQRVESYDNNPMVWLEPLMVRMAGEMRHAAAAPLIIDKLHEDSETLSEACRDALIKIGTDAAMRRLGEAFPNAEWHFRLYAASVLGAVPSDQCVQICREVLGAETDYDIRENLATALANQFSEEGNQIARELLLEMDPQPSDLKQALVVSCTLTGQDFPELAEWRKEMERYFLLQRNWGRAPEPAVEPPALQAVRRIDAKPPKPSWAPRPSMPNRRRAATILARVGPARSTRHAACGRRRQPSGNHEISGQPCRSGTGQISSAS